MKTEHWYYAGQRVASDGRLYHAWLRPGEDKFSLFDKVAGASIGCQYEVQVQQDDDGKVSAMTEVKYLPDEPHHKQAEEWMAASSAARLAITVKQREAKLKRESRDLGSMTLQQLSDTYIRLAGVHRPALLAQIISRVMRGA